MIGLEELKDLIRASARRGLWPNEICRTVSSYIRHKKLKLPLKARLYLAVRGFYPIITLRTQRWGPIEFYIVKCSNGHYYIDYPHGYKQYFRCPLCEVII